MDRSSHRVYTGQILVGFLKATPFMWVLVESTTRMLRGFHRKPVQLNEKRFTGILLLAVFLPFCRGHRISNNAYRCKFFPGFPLCFSVHCLGWCHSSFFPESHSASLCWSQREARNVDAWDWSQKMGGRCQRESEQTVRMIYPKKSRIVHGGKPKLMVYYHPSLASSVVTRMIAGNPKKTQPPPWSSNQPTFFADFSPRNAFGSETMNVPSLTS